jgi:integrase
MTPSRRYAERNPLQLVELPPRDEKPRLRVAPAAEAAQLLAALEPEDAVPYAIAFYAGLRRSEIHRLEWPEVLAGDRRLRVARSKSEAGTERGGRRSPSTASHIGRGLESPRPPPRREAARALSDVRQAGRARHHGMDSRWTDPHHPSRVPPHLRLAADGCGYTIKELMEFMGHADLQMVNRYVKLLPRPGEDDAATRLNDYLRRAGEAQ